MVPKVAIKPKATTKPISIPLVAGHTTVIDGRLIVPGFITAEQINQYGVVSIDRQEFAHRMQDIQRTYNELRSLQIENARLASKIAAFYSHENPIRIV